MDEATVFRLYIAREIMREGVAASQEPLPVSRMRSLLALDQAVELALRAMLPLTGESPKRNDDLPQLLKSIVGRKPAMAPYREGLERVRRLRDRVQHDGMIPSPEETRTASVQVEAFLAALVEQVGSLEELSLTALVQDEDARMRLRTAEAALRQDQYGQASIEAAIAFYGASHRAVTRIPLPFRENLSSEIVDRLLDDIGHAARLAAARVHERAFEQFADALVSDLRARAFFLRDIFEPFERAILFLSIGVALSDLHQFEEGAPRVTFPLAGTHQVFLPTRGWPPTREKAAYAVDFAVRAILRLESWARR